MNEDEIRDQGPGVRAHVWTSTRCSWNRNNGHVNSVAPQLTAASVGVG